MCCFLVVLGLLGPRVALLFEWIFTNRVAVAFHNGFIVPALGLVFLPWTTLVYTWVYAPVQGVSAGGWVLVALGFVVDISTWASGPYQRRRGTPAAYGSV